MGNEIVEKYLPIGSVVKLKENKKRWMIYGIKQTDLESNRKFDYIVVPYPEGNIGTKYQLMINSDIISDVVFRGLEDDERSLFIKQLIDYEIAEEKDSTP